MGDDWTTIFGGLFSGLVAGLIIYSLDRTPFSFRNLENSRLARELKGRYSTLIGSLFAAFLVYALIALSDSYGVGIKALTVKLNTVQNDSSIILKYRRNALPYKDAVKELQEHNSDRG